MADELVFGGASVKPDVRMLSDMEDVVYDRKWLAEAEDFSLYFMYRGLARSEEDSKVMRKNHLRYDVTRIPAGTLGCELMKTAGHYHPLMPGKTCTYTEIYEVISGEAHYLLQKEERGKIVDAVLVEAKAGDKVVIPPDYGHITINPGGAELKMSNYVSDRFSSIYGPYKEKNGGAYFELADGKFIPNLKYGVMPALRVIKARDLSGYGLDSCEMYSLIEKPEVLLFLNDPSRFSELFEQALK